MVYWLADSLFSRDNRSEKMYSAPMKIALLAVLFVGAASIAVFGQDVVVATKQTRLETKTFLFKFPVEAQRAERWEVVKFGKDKVSLTFGPNDDRRKMLESIGQRKPPYYELSAKDFAASFIPEASWPARRRDMAIELQKRCRDLSIEQCEKIIEGELWIGMRKEYALEAIGNRVFNKTIRETKDGMSETWQLGAFSVATTATSTGRSHAYDQILATPSNPSESLGSRIERDMANNIRMVLTFTNGDLSEIIRK